MIPITYSESGTTSKHLSRLKDSSRKINPVGKVEREGFGSIRYGMKMMVIDSGAESEYFPLIIGPRVYLALRQNETMNRGFLPHILCNTEMLFLLSRGAYG